MKRLLYIAMLLASGCTTSPTTGGKRLLGLVKVPFTGGGTLTEAGADHSWMFQLLALGAIALAIASSWIAKRVTKSGLILAGSGFAVSAWGLSMAAIKKSANIFIPWVVGGFLLLGAIDVAVRIYLNRRKKLSTEAGLLPNTRSSNLSANR